MQENQTFKIKDETGAERTAELLIAFEMEGKSYAIYSSDVEGQEMADIYSGELIANPDGTNSIKSIEDPEIKDQITKMIDGIINQ